MNGTNVADDFILRKLLITSLNKLTQKLLKLSISALWNMINVQMQ